MRITVLRWTLLACTCVFALPAHAATYLVYTPAPITIGGLTSEIYTVRSFEAHEGLAGRPLYDACESELRREHPQDMAAISLGFSGTQVLVDIAEERSSEPAVTDRILGAVFHTLRLAGVTEVRLGQRTLSGGDFSRGALLPVVPFAAALPPVQLTHGQVQMGSELLRPGVFYRRIAAKDPTIRIAVKKALLTGTTDVKLAVLNRFTNIPGIKDSNRLLLPALQDKDPRVRLAVLDVVRGRHQASVLNALTVVVETDPLPEAKTAAARILVEAGREGFQKYLLLEDLQSRDATKVIEAATLLIAEGDPHMAPALASLCKRSNPDVRQKGVEALQVYGQYAVMVHLLKDPEIPQDVAQPLARSLADKTVGSHQALGLTWLLRRGERDQAVHGAKVAATKGVAVIEALAVALKRVEPGVRAAAARALGALHDSAGLEPLAEAVRAARDDTERALFTEQAISIIAVQSEHVVTTSLSRSTDVTIRELAVKSLAEFTKSRPNPRVIEALRGHTKDAEPAIQRAAVYALARIKDKKVTASLVAMKDHQDAVIREQVAFALAEGEHAEAEPTLIKFLDDPDNRVKLQAVKSIYLRRAGAALPKLRWLLEYRHTDIRREVVRTVISLVDPKDPKMFDVYQQRLYDKDADVRFMVVEALSGYVEHPLLASVLGAAVRDEDKRVQLRALEILGGSQDENAVEQVIRGLFHPDKDVVMKALDALEQMKSPKAIKALNEVLKRHADPDVKKRIDEVLMAI